MTSALLLALLLGGRALAVEPVAAAPSYADELARASRLDDDGDPAAALAIGERLLADGVEPGPALVDLAARVGVWARRAGRPEVARAAERRLAALRPQTAETFVVRCRLRRDDDALAAAEALCAKAVAADPSAEAPHLELAKTLEARGRFDAAVEALRAGVSACPESGALRLALAGLLRARGRHEEALDLYAEARRRDPRLLAAYYEDGYARLALGDGTRALEVMREGIAASSGSASARLHLATGLWHHGRYREGLEEMEATRRLMEATPDTSDADLGHVYYWLSIMHQQFKMSDVDELLKMAAARWRAVRSTTSAAAARRHNDRGAHAEAEAAADEGLEECRRASCGALGEALLLAHRALARGKSGRAREARRDAESALSAAFQRADKRGERLMHAVMRLDVALTVAKLYASLGDRRAERAAREKARPWADLIPGHPFAARYRQESESDKRRERLRGAAGGPAAPLRGVILVSVDALRADRVGARRGGAPLTPALDALADGAVAFDNAVSQAPWTLPAMATLFTSLHPWRHTLDNRFKAYDGVSHEPASLPDSASTLAEAFKRAGYDTAAFTGGASLDGEYGFARGFDLYHDSAPFAGFETTVPAALDWLRARGEKPFFLFLHGYDAHGQHPEATGPRGRFAGPGYDGPFRGTAEEFLALRKDALYGRPRAVTEADRAFWSALYDERVAQADERLGRFLAAVEELPRVSSSVVIAVTSDHGEELFERGGVDHGATLYDEALRVPLLIRAPGHAPRRVAAQVRSIDLAPTLLDLAGVRDEPFALQAQGATLRPLMEGRPDAPRDALSETDFLYRVSKRSLRGPGGHKLIVDLETLRRELYDLNADPGETRDLSGDEPERVAAMERRLHLLRGLPLR
ncbi:MAG: sulfatase [Elusimicrobiota bacterium]|nr:sulfatase [Elusimicrobiota bacterium]